MHILMVYPEFPDTFWGFKHALRFVRKKASFPPLGLLTVAAMLPNDWEKRLIDMNVTPLCDRDLEWADYVLISAMVLQRESTHRLVARCKGAGVKMVAGGPLFIAEHADFADVDHFVLGEAEVSLAPFIDDLQHGVAKHIYDADRFPEMSESPVPMWGLMDMTQYASMCVQYSRGCPFDCEFCNITALFGHRPRVKSAEQIIAELDALYEQGWRSSVFFVDDNFIGNKNRLKREMLPALIEWRKGKSGMGFQTEVSINLADDPELMQLMVDAGFHRVFVGIETPDADALAECSKRQNEGRDLVASVKTLQRAGLEVQGGFIVGFDSDKASIFQRQIDFIQQSGIVTAMVGLLQAPHGTRLYKRMEGEGRILGNLSGDNTDASMNFEPKMDPEELHEGYRRIINTIYSPKEYYQRVRTFLSEYGKSQAIRFHIDGDQIHALFRSFIEIGVASKERWEYWKLLVWTLWRRPKLLPEAVTFAIYGSHFRHICDLYVNSGA